MGDIDKDGDLDLFIGEYLGQTFFYRNTGSPSLPTFTQEGYVEWASGGNTFGIPDVGTYASPALSDIDNDGDLDIFIGNSASRILFFRNIAAPDATTPAFIQELGANGEANPFGIQVNGGRPKPAFADADDDGDLDLLIGGDDGNTRFFRNTGSAKAPAFTQEKGFNGEANPFGIPDIGHTRANPAIADIDSDGDLDLFIGEYWGKTHFFRNTAATSVAPVSSNTTDGTYGIGDVINLTISFKVVVVDITSGTPTLQLETSSTDRYASYASGSGTSTLNFQYTVQNDDNTSDLDQFSSTASLLGGSIADAASNTAIINLAAPGEAGSLGQCQSRD